MTRRSWPESAVKVWRRCRSGRRCSLIASVTRVLSAAAPRPPISCGSRPVHRASSEMGGGLAFPPENGHHRSELGTHLRRCELYRQTRMRVRSSVRRGTLSETAVAWMGSTATKRGAGSGRCRGTILSGHDRQQDRARFDAIHWCARGQRRLGCATSKGRTRTRPFPTRPPRRAAASHVSRVRAGRARAGGGTNFSGAAGKV